MRVYAIRGTTMELTHTHTHGTLYSLHTRRRRRRRVYIIGIYKVAADEMRTAFRSGTRRRRLPCEFRPSSPRNERRTWKNGSLRSHVVQTQHTSQTLYYRHQRRLVQIVHWRSHVPSIVPSASENGSDAEEPRQRQRQFLRQPSQRLETSTYLSLNVIIILC